MAEPVPSTVLIVAADGDGVADALRRSPLGPFEVACVPGWAPEMETAEHAAVIADAAFAPTVLAAAGGRAVLVRADVSSRAELLAWIERGAQDVVSPGASDWPLRVSAAIERRRQIDIARRAAGIDLATGLPDRQQLVGHLSHLLALRVREPAPMAVLVLRLEGLATVQARLGRESAQVLRRKLAVRLRAAVRASDVVASIGEDRFAVLLSKMLAAGDALLAPVPVAGQPLAVAVAEGIALAPDDGDQPDPLLARASALAAGQRAAGRGGFANFLEGGGASAAND